MNRKRTDRVWKALSDPTRRRILDLLAGRMRTTGELSSAFPKLSRFAVMKHLQVLVRAKLVRIEREGRVRWNVLNPVPLVDIIRPWFQKRGVGKHEALWSEQLLNIRDAAEASPKVSPKVSPETSEDPKPQGGSP